MLAGFKTRNRSWNFLSSQMEKIQRKQCKMKVGGMAEQKRALESIWLIHVLLQVRREPRPQESPDELDGTW